MLRWKLKRRIEAFVLIQNESKKMNTARERLYEGNGVVEREWGKERKDGEDVGCEVQHGHFSTDAFTHRRFYTWTLLHTEPSTYRRFYRQDRRFYRQTDAFTDRQTLLQTGAFSHRRFYTQKFLHTDAFTDRRFCAQTLLHTDAFTRLHKVLPSTTLYYKTCTGGERGMRGGREGQLGVVIGCTPGNGRIKNDPQPWLVNGKAQLLGLPHYMKVTCYRTKMLLKHWKWAYNQQTLTTNGE